MHHVPVGLLGLVVAIFGFSFVVLASHFVGRSVWSVACNNAVFVLVSYLPLSVFQMYVVLVSFFVVSLLSLLCHPGWLRCQVLGWG